jgi:hypothetical protein
MTLPLQFLVGYSLLVNLAVIAAILALLRTALRRAGLSGGLQARSMITSSTVLLGWYGLVTSLAVKGVFASSAVDNLSLIPVAVFVPIVIGLWLILRSETFKAAIAAVPLSWLVGIQVYRVVGFAFLVVWGLGKMPGESAVPAGAGDVTVGLLAIPVAWAVARGFKGARTAAYVWNYIGILDFVVALAAGYLSSPGPFQVLALGHPDIMVSAYPMVMFPVFAIPISSLLHGICLWKLSSQSREMEASSSQIYYQTKPLGRTTP